MLDIKHRIEIIQKLLKEDTLESLTYAALECRLTIEMLCYERWLQSYDYLPYEDLKKWQPKDVIKQVVEDANELADKEFSLAVAKTDPQKIPEAVEEFESLDYKKLGQQAGLSVSNLGKMWNALSNVALHMSLPKSKDTKLSIYGESDSIRKHILKFIAELEKIKDGNLIMGGTLALTYSFNCETCGSELRKNADLVKSGQIANCSSSSCDESYLLEKNNCDIFYIRRTCTVACKECGVVKVIPANKILKLKVEATLNEECENCRAKMQIIWVAALKL